MQYTAHCLLTVKQSNRRILYSVYINLKILQCLPLKFTIHVTIISHISVQKTLSKSPNYFMLQLWYIIHIMSHIVLAAENIKFIPNLSPIYLWSYKATFIVWYITLPCLLLGVQVVSFINLNFTQVILIYSGYLFYKFQSIHMT